MRAASINSAGSDMNCWRSRKMPNALTAAGTINPARVKRAVADYGRGDKDQVQRMVCMQLGLAESPGPSDATDALAVALCHLHERQLSGLLARSE